MFGSESIQKDFNFTVIVSRNDDITRSWIGLVLVRFFFFERSIWVKYGLWFVTFAYIQTSGCQSKGRRGWHISISDWCWPNILLKLVKHHLRIGSKYGASHNGVMRYKNTVSIMKDIKNKLEQFNGKSRNLSLQQKS